MYFDVLDRHVILHIIVLLPIHFWGYFKYAYSPCMFFFFVFVLIVIVIPVESGLIVWIVDILDRSLIGILASLDTST